MTVLHDDGLYRHIQFGARGSVGWFELVTWPGYLAITGDFYSFTFARISDMFEFFSASGMERINPGYWAEKLVARGTDIEAVSAEKFTTEVVRYFWERREDWIGENAALFHEIREDVLSHAGHGSERFALDDFRYWFDDGTPFTFEDSWEWDLNDWSIHYLRACHAIVWGINKYRAAAVEITGAAA
ncbi:hypothetical protein [Nocardia xishanensis]|uniref:hypothetical protein n=1 Tax=Nocardia xishanensis TaxID=238964 RepID=UPI0009FD7601|nr:hypothetical protein [Nocardia xishanensis]